MHSDITGNVLLFQQDASMSEQAINAFSFAFENCGFVDAMIEESRNFALGKCVLAPEKCQIFSGACGPRTPCLEASHLSFGEMLSHFFSLRKKRSTPSESPGRKS